MVRVEGPCQVVVGEEAQSLCLVMPWVVCSLEPTSRKNREALGACSMGGASPDKFWR